MSPSEKQLAFSSQVPNSSLWVRVIRRFSRLKTLTTARIFCPTRNRSLGWRMRAAEMYSVGSRATMPRPMSTKAPKGSMRTTFPTTTAPGFRPRRISSIACSWTFRRESRAVGAPFASAERDSTVKQTCFPTLDKTAISRSAPLIHGAVTSSLGIFAKVLPSCKYRFRSPSHRWIVPSSTVPSLTARRSISSVYSGGADSPSGK